MLTFVGLVSKDELAERKNVWEIDFRWLIKQAKAGWL
jgi:hypothetical protein